MKVLFCAVDENGKLITTDFDYESLLLDCKKRGFKPVWITFDGGQGKTINWELVNINKALRLLPDHKFRWGKIKCWIAGACTRHSIVKKFNRESDFTFCKQCGKLICKSYEY